ncbi:MAG: hypothetical protein QM754_20940 [Tepidisphaeraceae bacterium]
MIATADVSAHARFSGTTTCSSRPISVSTSDRVCSTVSSSSV